MLKLYETFSCFIHQLSDSWTLLYEYKPIPKQLTTYLINVIILSRLVHFYFLECPGGFRTFTR